jgi:Thioredoxin
LLRAASLGFLPCSRDLLSELHVDCEIKLPEIFNHFFHSAFFLPTNLFMNYAEYLQYTETVLSGPEYPAPYDNPAYLEYGRLGLSRMNRWNKVLTLHDDLVRLIRKMDRPQTWIVITEPWCGDAAPMVPYIARLAEVNPLIRLDIQLRDQPPFLIEQYLTNGGKSIPILVVRDADGQDLFTWGPRPAPVRALVERLNAEGAEKSVVIVELQNWYNADRGGAMQEEWLGLFRD